MKNNILFICATLFAMTFTFCADPETDVDLNCLLDFEDLPGNCGLYPIPSENNVPLDFCFEIQADVDTAEVHAGLEDKINIEVDDQGNKPVIGAPHGAADTGTKDIAHKVGEELDYNSLSFFRFRTLLDANVNRPTLESQSNAQEAWDHGAATVYQCYHEHLMELFDGNNNGFYVEIHGNERAASAQRIEIVCSDDITYGEDGMIENIFEDEIQNEYGVRTPLHAYTLSHSPDSVFYTASATRSCGLFCSLEDKNIPAIHIEIPAFYRGGFNTAQRDKLINMLSKAIAKIDLVVL